ncbi:MAG TPA: DUF434 domain-containing protein, partial [Thermoanaerobaculia bacterium]|nr:DUF434 domain-containing protein [Thermoanaerobaculia bacterium]
MPDTRTARGPHPKDAECFAPQALPALRAAVADLSWLLDRGYPKKAALKLVGDRHALRDRQRMAVQRCAASDQHRRHRQARRVDAVALAGESLAIDGYNVLLTVEAALAGGVLLLGRDGVLRDLTSMSGHYRRMRSTTSALGAIAAFCSGAGCADLVWYFDRPISNSGRLKGTIEQLASEAGWPWDVRLVASPDRSLIESPSIVATADSGVLDRCDRWFNLAREVVAAAVPEAWILDLSG